MMKKKKEKKEKKQKKSHTVRDLFDYFVTSLPLCGAYFGGLTVTKGVRTISYFFLTKLVANTTTAAASRLPFDV
jgi:hypothetical protein